MTKRPKHKPHGRREQAKARRAAARPNGRTNLSLVEAGRVQFLAFTQGVRDFATDLEFDELARGIRKMRKPKVEKVPGKFVANLVQEIPQDFEPTRADIQRGRIPGALISVPRIMTDDTRSRRRGRRAAA